MTLDEAVRVVDELLTEQGCAAKSVRQGGSIPPMRLRPTERHAIECVLARALDRMEAME